MNNPIIQANLVLDLTHSVALEHIFTRKYAITKSLTFIYIQKQIQSKMKAISIKTPRIIQSTQKPKHPDHKCHRTSILQRQFNSHLIRYMPHCFRLDPFFASYFLNKDFYLIELCKCEEAYRAKNATINCIGQEPIYPPVLT